MKRAYRLRQYSKATAFEAPKGVVRVDIDPESGLSAGPNCPHSRPEYFIAGTAADGDLRSRSIHEFLRRGRSSIG